MLEVERVYQIESLSDMISIRYLIVRNKERQRQKGREKFICKYFHIDIDRY